jgi:hypothetical protein
VLALADAISDRRGLSRHLEAPAERLGEAFQHWRGQGADSGVKLADRGRIEGRQAGIEGRWLGCRR